MLSIPSTKIPSFCDCFQVVLLDVPGKVVSNALTIGALFVSKQLQVTSETVSRIDTTQRAIQIYGDTCLNVSSSQAMSNSVGRHINVDNICDLALFVQERGEDLSTMRSVTQSANFGPSFLTPQSAALFATTLVDSAVDFCALKINCKKNWVNLSAIELTKWTAAALVFSASGVALQTGLFAYGASRTISGVAKWLYLPKVPSEKTIMVGSYSKRVDV